MRKQGSCLQKEIMQGTMPGARRRARPRTAWMDNIKTWTGLPVEESIRMTGDRDKWRKYVHGVTALGLRTAKEKNRTASPVLISSWKRASHIHWVTWGEELTQEAPQTSFVCCTRSSTLSVETQFSPVQWYIPPLSSANLIHVLLWTLNKNRTTPPPSHVCKILIILFKYMCKINH